MKMRVALIGSGAVSSVHAAQLASQPDVELTAVYSRDPECARSFAGRYGVRMAASSLEEAFTLADAVIVCSPSPLHVEQARACLRAGRHTLVELPPCEKLSEAEELGALARKQGVVLGCAHTARYLAPYVRVQACLRSGLMGDIQEISYLRHLRLRARRWTDNALVHHAAHVIDLVLHWCGGLKPRACVAFPDAFSAQSVSLVAALPSGRALTVTVSYGATFPISRMVIVGAKHTIETDGFSYVRSDLEQIEFTGDERDVYERAISAQDARFIEACHGRGSYIPWRETEDLMRMIQRFRALSDAYVVSHD